MCECVGGGGGVLGGGGAISFSRDKNLLGKL